jgi:hypothetical protein
MKTKLIILALCILLFNAPVFAFYQVSPGEEFIPMQKTKPTKEDKKKPEKEEPKDSDSKDTKDELDKDAKDSKDKSLKDKVKDKLKKDKEKREGGRFGDKRF